MKNYNKRMIALIIAFIMVFNICPSIFVSAAEALAEYSQSLYYVADANYETNTEFPNSGVENGIFEVYETNTDYSGRSIIRWFFDYTTGKLSINGSGSLGSDSKPWSHLKQYIKSVEISEGIVNIGNRSFYNYNILSCI